MLNPRNILLRVCFSKSTFPHICGINFSKKYLDASGVMKENRNDITVLWDNSFYISTDFSGPYLQNVCWILCQIWKLHHGWWKILTLWYPDNWKMHLSVKYYYFPHTKLSPVPYPHPQVKTNYTHSP